MENYSGKTLNGLVEMGLTEKEALLYQAALKCGPTTAQILSLESGVKRATAYGCIESLIKKGLLHIEISGVRKLFVAESPQKMAVLLERKKQVLTSILPQLVQEYLQTSPSTNAVKMYHGVSGIKLLYDSLLDPVQPGDDYLVISDQEKWMAMDPEYFDSFRRKRSTSPVNSKLILKDGQNVRSSFDTQKKYKTEIRVLPKNISLSINMVMLRNQVILVQIVEPYLAIQIENPNVAAMNRAIFGIMWDLLPQI